MPAAETARMIAELTFRDKMSTGMTSVNRSLGTLDKNLGRVTSRTGAFSGALNRALSRGVDAGINALIDGVKSGIDSLATLESAVMSVDGAIAQVGLTGKVTGAQVATWANDIEASVQAAFDDKDIAAATSTLLRFGKVTASNLRPAMVIMTDLAAKTGSVDSAATLLAKALADPEKAAGKLARQGVILTKAEQAQIKAFVKAGKTADAQEVILSSLAKTTAGAAAAMNGPMKDAQQTLKDVGEDASRALAEGFVPVLKRVQVGLSNALADPKTLEMIRGFGRGLGDAFDSAVKFVEGVDWRSLGDGLKVAADWAGKLFGAFMALPPEVKGTILALGGLEKLSGGAVSGIVGELGKGLIKGVLGMTAGVVNINAGVVKGGGGLPGTGGTPGIAADKGPMGLVSTVAAGAGGAALLVGIQSAISDGYKALNPWNDQQLTDAIANAPKDFWTPGLNALTNLDKIPGALQSELGGIADAISGRKSPSGPSPATVLNDPTGFRNNSQTAPVLRALADTHSEQIVTTRAVEALRATVDSTTAISAAKITASQMMTRVAAAMAGVTTAMAMANAANRIVGAVNGLDLSVNVTTVNRTTTVNNRYGPSGGSGRTQRIPL